MKGPAMTLDQGVKNLTERGGATPQTEHLSLPQAAGPIRLKASPLLLVSLASALLLWACYFPLAWGWLAWVSLVPLLCLVRVEARKLTVWMAAWLCGSALFWPVLQWMRVADLRMYATWAMLAVYLSLYFPVAILLVR